MLSLKICDNMRFRSNEVVILLENFLAILNMTACNFAFDRSLYGAGVAVMLFLCRSSCFSSGSLIRLADNTEKSVDDLAICSPDNPLGGDTVLTGAGTKAYVIGLARSEKFAMWPLLKIRADANGVEHSISVTHNHLMCLNHGTVIQAGYLQDGDKVTSIYNESRIIDVMYSDAEETVFNFWLAPEQYVKGDFLLFRDKPDDFHQLLFSAYRQSLFNSTPQEQLVFSNGFLTGSMGLQNQMSQILRTGISLRDFL